MTDQNSHRLSGMSFLVGHWAGEGEWAGHPFVCRTEVEWLFERHLAISVRAEQEGRALHEEHVIVHADGDRLAATLYPDRGAVQRFEVLETQRGAAYRLVFTPPSGSDLSPQRWTIRRTDEGYEETFEIAHGGGEYTPSVQCAYVRDAGA